MLCRLTLVFIGLITFVYTGAQDFSGTWHASYQRDQPGNKRNFFYRFFLKQANDSLYGIGEALQADADIKAISPTDAVVVSRFLVHGKKSSNGSGRFELQTEAPLLVQYATLPQPPNFLAYHILACTELPVGPVNTFVSLLPFNDGTTATVSAVKISDEIPLNLFEDEKEEGKKREPLRLALPFRKKQKITAKEPEVIANRTEEIQHRLYVADTEASIAVYDNGMVDDDTISLYLNDKLLLSTQRVSSVALHVNITLEKEKENKLMLYAHNLGRIPPNTALVVITVAGKKQELRLASSLTQNAAAILIVKDQ